MEKNEAPNCWEFMGCGRQSVCPAHPNGGRVCYLIADTEGSAEGPYFLKIHECRECEFYITVTAGKTL